MRLSGVISRYIGVRFIALVAAALLLLATIILIVDALELLRRFGERDDFGAGSALILGVLRLPALLSDVLPFILLIGAMACLLDLSRKMELVVARATGTSAWGFLAAPMLIAVLTGFAVTLLYDPLAAAGKERAAELEFALIAQQPSARKQALWFRQSGPDGASIMSAQASAGGGRKLGHLSVLTFDSHGRFSAKIRAASATYAPGRWLLNEVRITKVGEAQHDQSQYVLRTDLTPEQIAQSLVEPQALPIWEIPEFVRSAKRAGLKTEPFTTSFHSRLARPMFFLAMVLIAAAVSLRLFRYGGIGPLIATGVLAGFMLFVFIEVMMDLGGAGIVPPILAGWGPPVIALTFGATRLLYLEDG